MAWEKTNVGELRSIAIDTYGLDVPEGASKAVIESILLENDVTERSYKDMLKKSGALKEEPEEQEVAVVTVPVVEVAVPVEEVLEEKTILIKMVRPNRTYEAQGIRFTAENPYAVVPESIAYEIFSREEGFQVANPLEAKEFYS